eukprot:GHVN01018677.1.p1 GENE.GHVN01018677.1~~GHVN01018677.1.p1  ORF type:complete len:343 (-),score=38.62 GHVN01018677.1:188-1216(-)
MRHGRRCPLQASVIGVIALSILWTAISIWALVFHINPFTHDANHSFLVKVNASYSEMVGFEERSFNDGVVTELDARFRAMAARVAGKANEVSKTKVAVVACTKSIPSWKRLGDSAAMKILLPSLHESVKEELLYFNITLYLCADQSDQYWHEFARAAIYEGLSTGIETKVSFHNITGRIPFNSAIQLAFDDGFEYFVRVNDDTQFASTGWVTLALEALGSFDPPNVGIVGPTFHEGKTTILTHDMAHRTHLRIFTDYYPNEFHNWYIDDWITHVYGPQRTKKLTSWIVKHLLMKMRYKPHILKMIDINSTIKRGSKQIETWLNLRCYHPSVNDSKCDAQVNK